MAQIKNVTIGCSACHQSLGAGYFTDAEVKKIRAEHQKHEHKGKK